MGMAASQARFLQLTARKTNIEYMGQQINQQRLALANESAGLFEKQLTMVPPVPPSSLDDSYYTPAYSFVDPTDGVQKKMKFTFDSNTAPTSITDFEVTYTKYNADGSYTDPVTRGDGDDYTLTDLDETWSGTDVTAVADTGDQDAWLISSTFDAANADYYDSATGRMKRIVIVQTNDVAAGSVSPENIHVLDLTYSPEFDEDAFNDDMNKYEYEKATYDYEIERINLETEKIQKQDKSLELKLKQLDTEHNAIQTEIDAVQKVIQKNVESSFKTFS